MTTIDALVDALEEFVGILPDDAWDKTLEARKKARAALARARSEQAESVNLSEFEDPQVQTVYEILCADEVPPDGEHWEGFAARRVVAALSTPPAAPAKLEPWMVHARKLVQWRHCMSYNDSYFGESPGLLKHITAELERLLPEEPLEAAHNAKLGGA